MATRRRLPNCQTACLGRHSVERGVGPFSPSSQLHRELFYIALLVHSSRLLLCLTGPRCTAATSTRLPTTSSFRRHRKRGTLECSNASLRFGSQPAAPQGKS